MPTEKSDMLKPFLIAFCKNSNSFRHMPFSLNTNKQILFELNAFNIVLYSINQWTVQCVDFVHYRQFAHNNHQQCKSKVFGIYFRDILIRLFLTLLP